MAPKEDGADGRTLSCDSRPWLPPVLNHANTPPNWMQLSVRAFKILKWLVDFDGERPDVPKITAYTSVLLKSSISQYQASKLKHGSTYVDNGKDCQDTLPSPFKIPPKDAYKWFDGIQTLIDILNTLEAGQGSLSMDECIHLQARFEDEVKKTAHLSQLVRPSATRWHLKRRSEMLRVYGKEIREIHRIDDRMVTILTVIIIVLGQIVIAIHTPNLPFFLTNFLAATVGSFFAYGYQCLNHILMHSAIGGRRPLALLASSATLLPWYSYYLSGGHARHHVHAGTDRDIDRRALFWIWERVPHKSLDNAFGSVLWVSTAAMFLPVAYMYSLFRCAYYDIIANITEIKTFSCDVAAKIVMFYFVCGLRGGGWTAFYYLTMSGFYSVGGLAHPYLGFWILQHVCGVEDNEVSITNFRTNVISREVAVLVAIFCGYFVASR